MPPTRRRRPAKDPNVLAKVQVKVRLGEYIPVEHAKQRLAEREVTDPELRYALLNGHREQRKDHFTHEYQAWNYAIRGNTVDSRPLRIVVSFDRDDVLIITVIDLERRDEN